MKLGGNRASLLWICVAGSAVACASREWLGTLSGKELCDYAYSIVGVPGRPVSRRDEPLAEAVFERWSDPTPCARWHDAGQFLTASQRLALLAARDSASSENLVSLFKTTGLLDAEVALLKGEVEFDVVRGAALRVLLEQSERGWGRGASAEVDASAEPLVDAAVTASELKRLIDNRQGTWPHDSWTLLARRCEEQPVGVVSALRDAVVNSELHDVPYWSAWVLIGLGEWDGRLLETRQLPWRWDAMKWYIPEAASPPARWQSFIQTMEDMEKQKAKLLSDVTKQVDAEEMFGYWLAAFGDPRTSPSALGVTDLRFASRSALLALLDGSNAQLCVEWLQGPGAKDRERAPRMHLRGALDERQEAAVRVMVSSGVCALMILAEDGDAAAAQDVFWGSYEGVYAANSVMERDVLEVAFRSGYASVLLERAAHFGGYCVEAAQNWVAYGNNSVQDLSSVAFRVALHRLLENGSIRPMRSALTRSWVLVST